MVAAAPALAAAITACLAATAVSTHAQGPIPDTSSGPLMNFKVGESRGEQGAFSISAAGHIVDAATEVDHVADAELDFDELAEREEVLEVLQMTVNHSSGSDETGQKAMGLRRNHPRHDSSHDQSESENGTVETFAGLQSMVYIKIPKTGGSTLGGVCRRIGARRNYMHVEDAYWFRNLPKKDIDTSRPSVWANHGKRRNLQRKIDKTMPGAFYLTSVRDPAERCMAAFYHFTVGRRGVAENNTDRKLVHIRHCPRGFETGCMRKDKTETAAEVFASYDFVLVTERFDESLLALRKAVPWLNLSLVDLLYLKAKESGKAATDHTDNFNMPKHVPLSQEPEAVREALAQRWVGSDDETLVKLAHQKLDRYRITHTKDYSDFQAMLKTVEKQCRSHFQEDCLWNDNGCGQSCIDAVAAKHGWGEHEKHGSSEKHHSK